MIVVPERHGPTSRSSVQPKYVPPVNGASRSHRLDSKCAPNRHHYQATGFSAWRGANYLLVDGGDEAGAGYLTRGLGPHRPNQQTFDATSPRSAVAISLRDDALT